MANRTILEEERAAKAPKSAKKTANGGGKNGGLAEREHVFELFRRWGFYEANLDPLGLEPRRDHPRLKNGGFRRRSRICNVRCR